jgi:hypothetical protein
MLNWLRRLFGANPIKIAGLVGSIATGTAVIIAGDVEIGIGIILSGISSNTALTASLKTGGNS